ncbi:hypothetical protein Poli38472_006982 [Pythium oligandrum]|uniref:Uncharacterized protein n=1 Tax=Pythium oligandrum TaxID=41045 RepID=A0A8K1C944_PYTOL|nr:hypothetical protein Poli38472_006982 [Pythium oligandrum]|eukprot:TMW58837.1 hypothetical protein Poli38472_006982 [Pythium oligandrum]
MTNRERAKYYRDKNREYDRNLTETVADLQEQARQLCWKAQILQKLTSQEVPCGVSDKILTQLTPLMTQPDELHLYGFKNESVEYQGAWMLGDADAPVVALRLLARGQYTKAAIEQVYQQIPGRKDILEQLLHNPVEYACIVRFFFTSVGECVDRELEVDWVSGLLRCLGCLEHVDRVVEYLRGSSAQDDTVECDNSSNASNDDRASHSGMSPMELEYILSDP